MSRKWKVRIALVCGACAAAFVAGEIVLRVFNLQPTRQHHKIFGEYDPVLGWRLRRSFVGEHKTREYCVVEKTNTYGFRGEEVAAEKSGLRVLVLGDSFAEGYTVAVEDRFSERLAATCGAEVINTGIGGYCTVQHVLINRDHGAVWKPDLVVLMWCDNDLLDNLKPKQHRGYKPYASLLPSGDVVIDDRVVPFPDRLAWHVRLRSASWLYMLARSALWRRPDKPVGWEMYGCPEDPRTEYAWGVARGLLQRLRDESAQFVVFAVPSRPAVCREQWHGHLSKYGINANNWQPRRIAERLRVVCMRNDIDFIDPFSTYHEADYFPRDGHWNEHGHTRAAAYLASYIEGLR